MKYTVKKGDSMYSIAKHFGIPFAEIVKANPGIQDPDVIYPEQVIEVPFVAASEGMIPESGPDNGGTGYLGGMRFGYPGITEFPGAPGFSGAPGFPGGMAPGYSGAPDFPGAAGFPGGMATGYSGEQVWGYPGGMPGFSEGPAGDYPGNEGSFFPGLGPSGYPGEGIPGIPGGLDSQQSGFMPGQIISQGEKGKHVQILQHRLKELGYFRGRVNGRYGRGTMSAVSRFQQECSMPVNGMVDYYVWSSLGIRE